MVMKYIYFWVVQRGVTPVLNMFISFLSFILIHQYAMLAMDGSLSKNFSLPDMAVRSSCTDLSVPANTKIAQI